MKNFHDKVDRSGGPAACWPWLASKDKKGYGRFIVGDRPRAAHRVAAFFAGMIPRVYPAAKHEWVLHSCDNPACCNPAHLFVGDHKTNMEDMAVKGRAGRPQMKLTDQDVRDIVYARSLGVKSAVLEKHFGVPRHMIWGAKFQKRRFKPEPREPWELGIEVPPPPPPPRPKRKWTRRPKVVKPVVPTRTVEEEMELFNAR